MPTEFYNPYHFVPLAEPLWTEDAEAFRDGEAIPGLGHDAYQVGHHSGRLICRLFPETPLVVGSRQLKRNDDPDDYTIVEPYRIGRTPALPATSLKGMISSLLESASGSALRVFDEGRPVSHRRPPNMALSALGRIVEVKGKLLVQPLTGPTIDADRRSSFRKWHRLFAGSVPLCLRFGTYPGTNQARDFGTGAFATTFSGTGRRSIAAAPVERTDLLRPRESANSIRLHRPNHSMPRWHGPAFQNGGSEKLHHRSAPLERRRPALS